MSLTCLPLILLTGVLSVLAAVTAIRLWHAAGRWRLPVRATGLLLVEVLVLLTIGLIANRVGGFYQSWRDLSGAVGAEAEIAPTPSGRLDGRLAVAPDGLPWTPPAGTAQRLAAPSTLIPPPGYGRLTGHAFPFIVALATDVQAPLIRAAAAAVPGVLTLVVTPSPGTVAADLAELTGPLERDARATGHDWAIVTDRRFAPLAEQWRQLAPIRFRTVTVVDAAGPATALDSAARQLPSPLAPPMILPS